MKRFIHSLRHPLLRFPRLARLATALKALVVLLLALAGIAGALHYLRPLYPPEHWFAWHMLWLWGATLAFVVSTWAFGQWLLGRLGMVPATEPAPAAEERAERGEAIPLSPLEWAAFSFAVGVVGFGLGMYALGFLGLFLPGGVLGLTGLMLLVGARSAWSRLRAVARYVARPRPGSAFVFAATLFGAAGLAWAYLGILSPNSINFDAGWYHLPIAEAYAREGQIIPFFSDYNFAFPHLSSLLYTWAYLFPGGSDLGDWMLCLHFEFALFVFTLAGVGAVADWCGRARLRGGWAVIFLWPSLFIYDYNLGSAADHNLAFFTPLIFLAVVRAAKDLDARWCALLAIVIGGASLTKYQAIYMAGPAALVLLGASGLHVWRIYRSGLLTPRAVFRRLTGPALAGALVLLIVAPHFVKNIVYYENPFFPFAQKLLGGYPSHPHAIELMDRMYTPSHPVGTAWDQLLDAVRVTFIHPFTVHYSFTGNVPMFGMLFTLLTPLVLFVRRGQRLWVGFGIGTAALFVWACTYQIDRYLQAILPLLAGASAAALVALWREGWAARAALGALLAFQLTYGGDGYFYNSHGRVTDALALIRTGFEKKYDRDYFRKDYLAITRQMGAEDTLLLHDFRVSLGINRRILHDNPGAQGLIWYEPLKTPRDLWETYRKLGVTHLVHNQMNGNYSGHTLHANALYALLIHHADSWQKRFGGFLMTRMPDKPPPDIDPKVAIVGTEYPVDGLYRLGDLLEYPRTPEGLRPQPLDVLARARSSAVSINRRADAVVLGVSARLPSDVKAALLRGMETATVISKLYTVFAPRRRTARPAAPPPPSAQPQGQ